MKIPVWLATIICAALITVVGYFGKCSIDASAAISSNKATVEALNTKVIDNKSSTNADVRDLKDAVIKISDKLDEMNKTLNRLDRRSR